MNRKDWEELVFSSDMNPTARMVCIAIGSHGNWTKDQEVRPSVQRIAGMAGMSRESAGKYVTALEDQGWLKHVRTLEKNIKVYELTAPAVVDSIGILAIVKRGPGTVKNRHQLSNESTSDSKPDTEQLSNDSTSDSEQLSIESEPVVDSIVGQLSIESKAVVDSYDTNLLRTYQKNLKEEPTTSASTVADAPVPSLVSKDSDLGEESDPSLPNSEGGEASEFDSRTGKDWIEIKKQRPLTLEERDYLSKKSTAYRAAVTPVKEEVIVEW